MYIQNWGAWCWNWCLDIHVHNLSLWKWTITGVILVNVFLDFYISVTLVFPGLDLFYFYLLDYLNIWKREDITYLKQHCLNTMEFESGPELEHNQGCSWTGSSIICEERLKYLDWSVSLLPSSMGFDIPPAYVNFKIPCY